MFAKNNNLYALLFRIVVLAALGTAALIGPSAAVPAAAAAQVTIYGSWHCSNDACLWGTVRDMTNFDQMNHWIINRGDGSNLPSVNLVILSFVEPNKLLNKTTDAGDV